MTGQLAYCGCGPAGECSAHAALISRAEDRRADSGDPIEGDFDRDYHFPRDLAPGRNA